MTKARQRTTRAIIYVRQSTRKEDSISPEVQLEHCLTACARQGYEVAPDPLTGALATMDLNLSGRSFKHRSISPIIQRIESGEAQIVMTWKWSRWGRNLVESLLCLAELKQAGGQLESATEPMDASTAAGRFSVTQMLAIAEFQSDVISDSWRDAKRSMVLKKGLPPTGGARLGYTYESKAKRYLQDPVSGPMLELAYARYVSGASFHQLTSYLRAKGIRSSRGNPIAEPGLRYAMDSGFAAGLIKLDKPEKLLDQDQLDDFDLEPGQSLYLPNVNRDGVQSWEPLIDEEIWFAYQVRRRRQRVLPPRARNATQPLTRLLRCAGCSKRMIYRPDRGRWVCSTQNIKTAIASCPVHVTISQEDVTHYVMEWLKGNRDGTGEASGVLAVQRQIKVQQATGDISSLERDLLREETRRRNLLDMAADGTLDRKEIRSSLDKINGEIERISDALVDARRERTVNTLPPVSAFGAVLDGWNLMDPSILNQGLRQLVAAVYVYPFREFPRVLIAGTWEGERDVPAAVAPVDDADGRVCLGCHEWKPREEFYVRKRGEQLMSRCKQCKSSAAAEWREAQKVLASGD